MSSTARFLLFVLLVVVGVKLSEQVYRLVAFADERAQVVVLRERLLDAGARLEAARAEARRVRARLEEEDARLEEEHEHLQRYERLAQDGRYLPADVYAAYKAELETYNRHVVERNALNRRLGDLQDRSMVAGESYTALADSIRDLATRMGEPYYSVPTPVEAAIQRGTIKPEP